MTLLKALSSKKNVQKYVCRGKEPERTYRRRSTFGVGNDSQQWSNYLEKYAEPVEELMKLTRNKRHFYRHGFKAVTLIRQGYSLEPPQHQNQFAFNQRDLA